MIKRLILSIATLALAMGSQADPYQLSSASGVSIWLEPLCRPGYVIVTTKSSLIKFLKKLEDIKTFQPGCGVGSIDGTRYKVTKIGKYRGGHPSVRLKKISIIVDKKLKIKIDERLKIDHFKYYTVKSIKRFKRSVGETDCQRPEVDNCQFLELIEGTDLE